MACRRVPDLHRPVIASRDDPPAVRAEGHASNPCCVSLEREGFLACRRVPDLHRLVPASRDDPPAVRAERHARNRSVCPLSVRVSWPVAASQTFTVLSSLPETIRRPSGLKATLLTRFRVSLEREGFLARRRVPDLHRAVLACRRRSAGRPG